MEGELHKMRAQLEEETAKSSTNEHLILTLQQEVQREKEKMSAMETEHAEQLNKMEKGDQVR